MSLKAFAWAWEQSCKPIDKLVLLALADMAGTESMECYPGIPYLSAKTCANRATVHRSLNRLEEGGQIERITQHRKDGGNTVNLYRLLMKNATGGVAHSDGGGRSQRRGGVAESDTNKITTTFEPSYETQDCSKPKNGKLRPVDKSPTKSAATWQAYASAYLDRYGTEPVRNAKVSSSLCQLVDRLGEQEAPQVAAYYLGLNNGWYVKRVHDTGTLLKDCESIRTQWATQTQVTGSMAANADKTANRLAVADRLMAKYAAEEAGE